jgi:hypothetical protein
MATLNVKTTETLILNGTNVGSSITQSIDGINYADNRNMSLPSGSTTGIANFSANPGAGTFSTGSFKYGRFTNTGTVPIKLYVISPTVSTSFLVSSGSSFTLSTTKITGSVGSSFTFENITNINAEPSGSVGSLEYYIATT